MIRRMSWKLSEHSWPGWLLWNHSYPTWLMTSGGRMIPCCTEPARDQVQTLQISDVPLLLPKKKTHVTKNTYGKKHCSFQLPIASSIFLPTSHMITWILTSNLKSIPLRLISSNMEDIAFVFSHFLGNKPMHQTHQPKKKPRQKRMNLNALAIVMNLLLSGT